MGGGFEKRVGGQSLVHETFGVAPTSAPGAPGKRSLVEQIAPAIPAVQRLGAAADASDNHVAFAAAPSIHAAARAETAGDLDSGPPLAPSELPYRSEMERSFGRSLGHLQAYTGASTELAAHGAQALAAGNVVKFADANPSPAIVAHEVTHAIQNAQAGAAAPMAAGAVGPRHSPAEAEADDMAARVAAAGPGVKLPPVIAAPAANIQLAPKLLVPEVDAGPRTSTIQVPDADHPSKRDVDGEQVIQVGQTTGPGKATPVRSKSWKSIATVAESVVVQDDSGDTLRIDLTYRLESRPAEIGEVPDIWIHTERKALLTIGSGEHAGATIVGQARVHLAADQARDPRSAIAHASLGAAHSAQIYLAEAQQYVHVRGAGGRASLLADAADDDVLAYDDPLRTLVGLKRILKQQHVAGRGGEVAQRHARAQRLLADAKRGRAVLEREIASIHSHHDAHPGMVAPVRFLVGDITEWLAANQQAGRDNTEAANQLRKARAELEQLIADADSAHAPKRDQLDDALSAPVRFAERTAEGVVELGAMVVDAAVLGVDAIGDATGIGSFNYDPISKYGQWIRATGNNTTAALVTMVNGFADQWSDALERAKHGDYRSLTDVGIDTLMMIDGARVSGPIALAQGEALVGKLSNVAKSARGIVSGIPAEARDIVAIASRLPAEARNIAAAMADGADAFVARLRANAGGMQMATEGGGGGPGPPLGGLSADALAEAAQAAKEAFKDKRLEQQAHAAGQENTATDTARQGDTATTHADSKSPPVDAISPAESHANAPSTQAPARIKDTGGISGVPGSVLHAVENRVAPHQLVDIFQAGGPAAVQNVYAAITLEASGRLRGLSDWIAFADGKVPVDLRRTLGELAEAQRLAEANPRSVVNIGGDQRAPRRVSDPTAAMPTFDITLEAMGGGISRSVEVTTVDAPVSQVGDVTPGVRHAVDKVEGRGRPPDMRDTHPIPGDHDVTIRMTLAVGDTRLRGGRVRRIAPNGEVRIIDGDGQFRARAGNPTNLYDDIGANLATIHNIGNLSLVILVDQTSHAVLATYKRVGALWTRVP